MKRIATAMITIVMVALAAGAGYWWGASKSAGADGTPVEAAGRPEPPSAKTERKILYYRNPMGLPDTSPVPKKDQMGMDYIPVFVGEEPASEGPVVKISLDKVQKLGVRTEAVAPRALTRTVRAVATIEADERRLHTVSPKFEGWIQKLHVNTTGQAVRKGEALMDVYSPDLITTQQEYLIAWKGTESVKGGSAEVQGSMRQLAETALQRLRNWDISEPELRRLQTEGKATQYLTLRSPASGVVLEKPSIAGKRFMAGEVLYQVADLSNVWTLADVFEQDLGMIHQGQSATIKVDAYPDRLFEGKVRFVYPTVTAETRTAKVRIELANTQGLLKPAMYARVEFASSHGKGKALTVPDSAVLDTGTRQLVLVQRGEGAFEPRPVKLGTRADGYIEVLEGVKEGEKIVVSANFLIDAESNLKAALGSFGHAAHGGVPDTQPDRKAGTQGTPAPEEHAAHVGTAARSALATHHGEGRVEALDLSRSGITLTHEPIASLKWPAMTMDFRVKDPGVLKGLKPGQKIAFDMIEEEAGDYVIVRVQPSGAAAGPGAHRGH